MIVSSFSWELWYQEKTKTMVIQNLGGIMVFSASPNLFTLNLDLIFLIKSKLILCLACITDFQASQGRLNK